MILWEGVVVNKPIQEIRFEKSYFCIFIDFGREFSPEGDPSLFDKSSGNMSPR
jgi:hypothetical protein